MQLIMAGFPQVFPPFFAWTASVRVPKIPQVPETVYSLCLTDLFVDLRSFAVLFL